MSLKQLIFPAILVVLGVIACNKKYSPYGTIPDGALLNKYIDVKNGDSTVTTFTYNSSQLLSQLSIKNDSIRTVTFTRDASGKVIRYTDYSKDTLTKNANNIIAIYHYPSGSTNPDYILTSTTDTTLLPNSLDSTAYTYLSNKISKADYYGFSFTNFAYQLNLRKQYQYDANGNIAVCVASSGFDTTTWIASSVVKTYYTYDVKVNPLSYIIDKYYDFYGHAITPNNVTLETDSAATFKRTYSFRYDVFAMPDSTKKTATDGPSIASYYYYK